MTPPFPYRDLGFALCGYLAAISSLAELTELELFAIVFFLGGFLGAAGKMIRARKSESLAQGIVIGMAMALLGILFASLWEERIGRNACAGVALVLSMMGADGAKLIIGRARGIITNTGGKS